MEDDKKDKALEDELQVYELGYHLLPTVAEENISKEISFIKEILEKRGALFIGEEGMPKIINLAYSMDKIISNKRTSFSMAHFGWMKFESTPESVISIKKELEKAPNILRFLLIKSVRESKMVSRKTMAESRPPEKPMVSKPEAEKEKGPISEVEVDQAIEELVVE